MKKLGSIVLWFCMLVTARAQYPGPHDGHVEVPIQAYGFDLQDVRLLDGPFLDNMKRDQRWLLSLETNRLLHSFRVNAGMRSDAKALGGWEALDMELRGHTAGHILSALALMYASTGDTVYKNKGDSLVSGLAEVQRVLGQGGYLSAFPQHFIDRCIAGQYVWAPWYTLHKIMAGLLDMYTYTHNAQALDVAEGMGNWAAEKLSPLEPEKIAVMLKNEFGGMNEAFFNLYAVTGNSKYRHLAELFYHHASMDPLAACEDKLNGLHGNTTIPKVIGQARGYELTGDKKDSTIAAYFWEVVVKHHTYATGGNSDKEHFDKPDDLSEHLTEYTSESCNTYNMLKLTRHLFCWTAGEKYAEYYERALYNHTLASQDPATGLFCYFMPAKPGVFKLYSTPENSFWCCVGTGSESQAKYGEGIYYHDDRGIYVNLFIPSELHWREKGVTLRQETRFPDEDTTRLTIVSAASAPMNLYIRYPEWAVSGAVIKINGRAVNIKAHPGNYVTLSRQWKSGDRIEIVYPMSLRLIPTPGNDKEAAVAYGPIVLAAPMGKEGMSTPEPYAPVDNPYSYYTYSYRIPSGIVHTLQLGEGPLSDYIQPVKGSSLTFRVTGTDIRLVPYFRLNDQRYTLYWDIQTPDLSSVYQYSVGVGSRTAYLWIPPDCRYVRGVIIALSNLLERNWLEDPLIRKTAAREGLGIIWVGPGKDALLKDALTKLLDDLAKESGYKELAVAPIIATGHSANGPFAWDVPGWNAARTIAAIPIKTLPLPDTLNFTGVPLCYIVGQTTEWPQYRVPDPATHPGDRDFFWPVVRHSAVALREKNANNLIGVVTDPGGGHFDWSEHLSAFLALYIQKACEYRLAAKAGGGGRLRLLNPIDGWLTDTGGMDSDQYAPASYKSYKGDPRQAYWFFDRETALAASTFEGDRKPRARQMITFIQDGQSLPVAKQGFAPLRFEPDSDGLSFTLQGTFLTQMPPELIGSGTPLGHAQGPIRFRVITGPAVQTGPHAFRVRFDRSGIGGDIWIQETHPGDDEYRPAVQPGKISIPARLTQGVPQTIYFPAIANQPVGTKTVPLNATSDSGLPVDYYVVSGPAVVEGNHLWLTEIPIGSRYPVRVTVVAYQWGRMVPPLYQSAEPTTKTFYVTRN